jgi:tetratricopeptide (TPR) repeat protein
LTLSLRMKLSLFVVVLFCSVGSCYSQNIVVNNETVNLYGQINESLAAGDARQAIQHFKKVIDVYVRENREREIPENYFGMALAFAFSGHYKESVRYHKKAIRAHRKYKSNEEPIEMVINLGLTYELMGKNRKAKRVMG